MPSEILTTPPSFVASGYLSISAGAIWKNESYLSTAKSQL